MFFTRTLALLLTLCTLQAQAGKLLQARISVQNPGSSEPEEFVVEAHEDWAPNGYKRFKDLIGDHYFDKARIFRVVENFVAQWGLPADPKEADKYQAIPDDKVVGHNDKGIITFAATAMKNSRTTQLFVNLKDNHFLDGMGFAPVAKVVEGMDVVERINAEYGEHPNQGLVRAEGEQYLAREFPRLTRIVGTEILEEVEGEKDEVLIEAYESWAPKGYARLKEILEDGYFDEARFFRVLTGFVAQWGLPADPSRREKFPPIDDDPVVESNKKGTISFASAGPNTRTTQMFINLADNVFLDTSGFAPVARVLEGMVAVESINAKYGEEPDQGKIQSEGEKYLQKQFPRLTKIRKVEIIEEYDDSEELVPRPPTKSIDEGVLMKTPEARVEFLPVWKSRNVPVTRNMGKAIGVLLIAAFVVVLFAKLTSFCRSRPAAVDRVE
ncbi:hypothetical protein FOZ61_008436 [Perkinsus olseni]|uniref:peptidylprolyl isomerase n=1 Tax=Perkinsus olseni TaxID=32597 RepID=A0A7J6M6Z7_PEROL|nr:hypothetical protein FOZ61_008436 [Perkinsus olseni]